MKNIIVNTEEAGKFLSLCVYFERQATVVNCELKFLNKPERLIFKINKQFNDDQFELLKKEVPSLEYAEWFYEDNLPA